MTLLNCLNDVAVTYKGLVDVAAVLATLSAALISLKIANDGIKSKLKVVLDVRPTAVEIMYSHAPADMPNIPNCIGFRAYNVGHSDVYVRRSGLYWKLPWPSAFSLTVYVRDSSGLKEPSRIERGGAIDFVLLDGAAWEINRIIDDPNFSKIQWWQNFLYLEVTTDSQVRFKASLPKELKAAILWASKNNQ